MELDIADTDVFAYYVEDDYISIQVFHIRGRKTVERNGYLFELIDSPEEIFANFIAQFYLIKNNPIPKEILVPEIDLSLIEPSLTKNISIPKIGKKKDYINLVYENAKIKLNVLKQNEKLKYDKHLVLLLS